MLENPTDGKPWLGLLMLRADRQRQGLAEEVFLGLVEHLREQGYSALRAGVIETNHEGRRLTTRLGFRAVDSKKIRLGSGEHDILVLERAFE
jgi:GNAT superfamily N-acetyltransferase